MTNPGVCYCGAYGGGVHTKSARCGEQAPSKELSPMQELRELVETQAAARRFMSIDMALLRRVVSAHEPRADLAEIATILDRYARWFHTHDHDPRGREMTKLAEQLRAAQPPVPALGSFWASLDASGALRRYDGGEPVIFYRKGEFAEEAAARDGGRLARVDVHLTPTKGDGHG